MKKISILLLIITIVFEGCRHEYRSMQQTTASLTIIPSKEQYTILGDVEGEGHAKGKGIKAIDMAKENALYTAIGQLKGADLLLAPRFEITVKGRRVHVTVKAKAIQLKTDPIIKYSETQIPIIDNNNFILTLFKEWTMIEDRNKPESHKSDDKGTIAHFQENGKYQFMKQGQNASMSVTEKGKYELMENNTKIKFIDDAGNESKAEISIYKYVSSGKTNIYLEIKNVNYDKIFVTN